MSVFEERRDALEKHEFMMGKSRGQLAVTLDVLTDALVLVGQHYEHGADLTRELKNVGADASIDHRPGDWPRISAGDAR